MTLKEINQTIANSVFEFIRKHPDVPDDEIETAIRNHFQESEHVNGAIQLYITMKRRSAWAQKLGAPKKVVDECWSTIENVRRHRSERARSARKPAKQEKGTISQKNNPKNIERWEKLLALASKDPKGWAKVLVNAGLVLDLSFALTRNESVNARENWFREKIRSDGSLRKRVQAMLHEINAKRELMANDARRKTAQRFSASEEAAGIRIEVMRQKGEGKPLAPIRGPRPEVADILIHGPNSEKLIPKNLRSNPRPPSGGGSGEAPPTIRQYRTARQRRRR